MRFLVALLMLTTACGPQTNAPGASPSDIATASAAPTPSPTLKPNPTAGPGTYTSIAHGYSVALPAGWRRSACQSSPDRTEPPVVETFTTASVDEESGSDVGSAQDIVIARAEENAAKQTGLQWLEAGKMGFAIDRKIEQTTFDGHADAARLVTATGGIVLAYVVPARGLMYAISREQRAPSTPTSQAGTSLIASLHILSDAEVTQAGATLSTPAPVPARTAEEVADALAKGFSQKDTSILAPVADACLSHGVEQAGVGFAATSKVLSDMQKSFANGLVVVAQPRPLEDQSTSDAVIRGTWKDPGQPQKNVKFMLRKVGNTWYWSGWIDLQPR